MAEGSGLVQPETQLGWGDTRRDGKAVFFVSVSEIVLLGALSAVKTTINVFGLCWVLNAHGFRVTQLVGK